MPPRIPPGRCRDCPLPSLSAFWPSHLETIRRAETARTGTRRFRGGEYIFHAGDPVQEAHTLFDGYAVVSHPVGGDKWQVVRFVLPGDLLYQLPESGLTWWNSAQVVDHATTCVLAPRELNALFQRDPGFAQDIARVLDFEHRLLEEHISDMGQRPAVERVARLLLELFDRQRRRGKTDGGRCHLPFTREQIGDATGLTSVYVSRLVGQLEDAGVLSFRERWLKIPDFDAAARRFEYSSGHLEPKPMI